MIIRENRFAVDIKHFHLFCGLGGGARGFNRGQARVGSMRARFRCIGGIDVDPASIADFGRLAGVPGTVLDLFDRDQYLDFHGKEPPAGWREADPDDIRRAAGGERPHIVFLSSPCKGFSGLLPEASSKTPKYQALNRLTVRGIWLMLEAWSDDPPEFILFENVPRIAKRGRHLLDQIGKLLRRYGYAVAETTHDCGELGGLGQSRKRFLLVARHAEKVPPFLYEPDKKRLRTVGDILGPMPLPGDEMAGAMHRVPNLQWKTWVRLAFVEAGSDWRSLEKLRVVDGMLADFGLARGFPGYLGVNGWGETASTVAGRSTPTNGKFAVADPRPQGGGEYGQFGVQRWEQTSNTIGGQQTPGQGRYSVADPRLGVTGKFNNAFRIVRFDDTAPAVTGGTGPSAGGIAVADPRTGWPEEAHSRRMQVLGFEQASGAVTGSRFGSGAQAVADPRPGYGSSTHRNILKVTGWDQQSGTVTGASHVAGGALAVADPRSLNERNGAGKYRVTGYDEPAGTVIAASTTGNGAFAVADPRPEFVKDGREHYRNGGHYGVVPWEASSGAVTASGQADNGFWSVADPRPLPEPNENVVAHILALDGTWHRPFTTLELAGLQGLVDAREHLELAGLSDSAWRERIGNAVPPPAAEAIAGVMGRTLLLAWAGETFQLSASPIWVRPIVAAMQAGA